MSVNYNRLWKLLIDKNLKRTDLINMSGISSNILAKLGKNETVSMNSIESICFALHCTANDIMEFINESGEKNEKNSL